MKRVGNLFEKVYEIDNLRLAYRHAKKGKGWYEEVLSIEKGTYPIEEKYKKMGEGVDPYLYKIQDMIKEQTFQTSKYTVFHKPEGNKIRKIYKLPFYPDRVVQWALMQVIEPYLMAHFITDTYSSIKGRGLHYGLTRIQNVIKHNPSKCRYCLKLDIRHFYQSINHKILKQKYRKLFKDKKLLWLIDEIIDSVITADEEDLFFLYGECEADGKTGIPIGNYLSQFSGNFYLSEFDHWIKECMHVNFYYRYMDDIVILAETKEQLHELLNNIQDYLYQELKVKLKHNWQIFPTYVRGVDYLGYRIFKDYVLLRKSTAIKLKKKMKVLYDYCILNNYTMTESQACSINSYHGTIKHCNSFRLTRKYIIPLKIYVNLYYNKVS